MTLDPERRKKALMLLHEIKTLVSTTQTAAKRAATRRLSNRPADTGTTFTKNSASTDAKSGDLVFKSADGKPFGGEANGLISLYRKADAEFRKMAPDNPTLTGGFSTTLSPRAKKGRELLALVGKLHAKGITVHTLDFGELTLTQLDAAIKEIEAEIAALNAEKERGRRSYFYPFFRQAELDALIARWTRMLASRKTWEQWQTASANRASVPLADSPETAAKRVRVDKLTDRIKALNLKLEKGTLLGSERKELDELRLESGKLLALLR